MNDTDLFSYPSLLIITKGDNNSDLDCMLFYNENLNINLIHILNQLI